MRIEVNRNPSGAYSKQPRCLDHVLHLPVTDLAAREAPTTLGGITLLTYDAILAALTISTRASSKIRFNMELPQ